MLLSRDRLILAVTLIAAGCGDTSPLEKEALYDSQKAKDTLIAALDAWKRGDAKSLTQRVPAIRFSDDDLVSGWKLADYQLEEPEAPILARENVPVILELRDGQGKRARREAQFQVGLEPRLTVLRTR